MWCVCSLPALPWLCACPSAATDAGCLLFTATFCRDSSRSCSWRSTTGCSAWRVRQQQAATARQQRAAMGQGQHRATLAPSSGRRWPCRRWGWHPWHRWKRQCVRCVSPIVTVWQCSTLEADMVDVSRGKATPCDVAHIWGRLIWAAAKLASHGDGGEEGKGALVSLRSVLPPGLVGLVSSD